MLERKWWCDRWITDISPLNRRWCVCDSSIVVLPVLMKFHWDDEMCRVCVCFSLKKNKRRKIYLFRNWMGNRLVECVSMYTIAQLEKKKTNFQNIRTFEVPSLSCSTVWLLLDAITCSLLISIDGGKKICGTSRDWGWLFEELAVLMYREFDGEDDDDENGRWE